MTAVDWVIVALALLMAAQGYARGLLVGVAALAGFILGALVGSRIAPLLLSGGARSPYAPWGALVGALLLGGVLATLFEAVARRVRRLVWFPPLRAIDGLAGAALTACVGLGIAWIVGAALRQNAENLGLSVGLRHDLQSSRILTALDRMLPPSGTVLHALASIDPLPSVSAGVTAVPAPALASLTPPGVRSAAASVVRIIGTACGLGVEGSGWVAAPGVVVTNAHVVAGEQRSFVQVEGVGAGMGAQVMVFDPHNDIAVLRVPGLNAPALSLASGPATGAPGAILGYPLAGPYTPEPATLGDTQFIVTENAYGTLTTRDVSTLRGLVRPGNSGGPVVGRGGRVMGTVFARITNTPADEPAGLAVPNTVVRSELDRARRALTPVGTGGCAG
ncbi:MAG: MarP family serine protease [Solirubrobacteraceae bacterium]